MTSMLLTRPQCVNIQNARGRPASIRPVGEQPLAAGEAGRTISCMRLALAITLAWLGTASAAAPVEVLVKDLRLDPDSGSPVVQLVEKGGRGRSLPIWIGPFEAQAIAVELEGVGLPRPSTHDL